MFKIKVLQLNANDESCKLVEWYFQDGDLVKEGDLLASIETSKASEDIECTMSGILNVVAGEGDELKIGGLLGYIFENEEEKKEFYQNNSRPQEQESKVNITRLAEELMKKEGISEKQVLALGKKVISKSDIEKLIGEKATNSNGNEIQISKHQQLVAKVVSKSHAEIPSASLLMKVYCDNAFALIQEFNREQSQQIGITEIVIKILSELHANFPFFFGHLQNESTFIPSEKPNIGITMDLGKGLFIPVVKAEQITSIQEIGNVLMDYKIKALRNNFKEEELSGGNITISLNTDRDIVAISPVILHGQTCMISINAVQEELYRTGEGKIEARTFINIGLTYDHRVINGFGAVQFLKSIKEKLETSKVEELFAQTV